jgi:hypothetical protein
LAISLAQAQSDWPATISMNNTDQDQTDTYYSPTATTGGAFWINQGDGPVLLQDDINVQLLGGLTPTALTVLPDPGGGPPATSTLLLSDGTASGDISAFAAVGPGYYGLLADNSGSAYVVPGATTSGGDFYFCLLAWTGLYNTFDTAASAGAYVADSGVFLNPTGGGSYSDPPGVPANLDNMPAMVLKPTLPGDANLDGTVDINDLTIVLAHYGQTGMTWSQGEFTGDGTVDINDLTIVLAHYSQSVGAPAGPVAVPEPSTFLLVVIGLSGLLGNAWKKQR